MAQAHAANVQTVPRQKAGQTRAPWYLYSAGPSWVGTGGLSSRGPPAKRPGLPPAHTHRPGMQVLNLRYHKRFQMELDLRRWRRAPLGLHPDYRLRPWSDDLVREHAEAKFHS